MCNWVCAIRVSLISQVFFRKKKQVGRRPSGPGSNVPCQQLWCNQNCWPWQTHRTQLWHWPYPIHTASLIWRPPENFFLDASGSVGDVEGQLPDDAHSGLKSSFNLLGTSSQMKLDPMLHFRKEFQSKLHEAIIPNYSKHDHVHTDFIFHDAFVIYIALL